MSARNDMNYNSAKKKETNKVDEDSIFTIFDVAC